MTSRLDIVAALPGPAHALTWAESLRDPLAQQSLIEGWLAPDITGLNQLLHDLALLAHHAVEHNGAADLLDDRTAAALWSAVPPPPVASLRRCAVEDGYAARWAALEHAVHSTVPAGGGGHLLVLLAAAGPDDVAADRAAALLRHHHSVLDDLDIPAYAAAYTITLRRLLTQHGWTAGPRRELPDGSPWWPMRRQPFDRRTHGPLA